MCSFRQDVVKFLRNTQGQCEALNAALELGGAQRTHLVATCQKGYHHAHAAFLELQA